MGGCLIDLTTLNTPVLNIYAEQDHLVPPESSKALGKLIEKKNYTEMSITGGHIGFFVSPKSIQKIFLAVADWFSKHS